MSEPSKKREDSTNLMETDNKLLKELVTKICLNLISQNDPKTPLEENLEEVSVKTSLKQNQESIIKELVSKFMAGRENVCNVSEKGESCEGSGIEGCFPEETVNSEICEENAAEENVEEISSRNEINGSTLPETTSKSEKTETKEEKLKESKECVKNKQKEAEGIICEQPLDIKSEAVVEFKDNFIIETSAEIEKEIVGISLTPEEEEEVKRLVLSAEENDYDKVIFKNEKECDGFSAIKLEGNEDVSEGSVKAESGLDDVAPKRTKHQLRHHLSPPMYDVRGPFFIKKRVPFYYYEAQLISKLWNCTQTVFELCVQCNWTRPEYKIIQLSKGNMFWSLLKVNNHIFGTHKKANTKKEAKHLVAARFLKFLGFTFSYDTLKNFNLVKIKSEVPWCEVYSNYNSSSLESEEDRLGGFKKYTGCNSPKETKTDIDILYYLKLKRRRSGSSEFRDSKTSRNSSPEKKIDIVKRIKISDDGTNRVKLRRHISPESSRRDPNLRMDHEGRKRRVVHERISITHRRDHGYKTSHSSHSRYYRDH